MDASLQFLDGLSGADPEIYGQHVEYANFSRGRRGAAPFYMGLGDYSYF
jgi:hypothetical protein